MAARFCFCKATTRIATSSCVAGVARRRRPAIPARRGRGGRGGRAEKLGHAPLEEGEPAREAERHAEAAGHGLGLEAGPDPEEDSKEASGMVRKLLEKKTAAPVNILPELPKHTIGPMALVPLGALASQPRV